MALNKFNQPCDIPRELGRSLVNQSSLLTAFIYRYFLLLWHAILNEWLYIYNSAFGISTEVVYLQRSMVVTWLVQSESAAVSAHVLYTLHNVTSCKAAYVG